MYQSSCIKLSSKTWFSTIILEYLTAVAIFVEILTLLNTSVWIATPFA